MSNFKLLSSSFPMSLTHVFPLRMRFQSWIIQHEIVLLIRHSAIEIENETWNKLMIRKWMSRRVFCCVCVNCRASFGKCNLCNATHRCFWFRHQERGTNRNHFVKWETEWRPRRALKQIMRGTSLFYLLRAHVARHAVSPSDVSSSLYCFLFCVVKVRWRDSETWKRANTSNYTYRLSADRHWV